MDFLWDGVVQAFSLLVGGDEDTWRSIWLSLWTSVLAVGIGAGLGVPAGAWVGLFRPRGSRAWAFLFRVGMSVPTVFVGLVLYGLISRKGPLSGLSLLYSPWAIVIGEAALAFPILASFVHASTSALDPRATETVRTHGGGRRLALSLALSEIRPTVVASSLSAFGRCITELGVALLVGGSIKSANSYLRTLPAQVTLETSRGEFGRALAPGIILVLLACGAAAVAHGIGREERR